MEALITHHPVVAAGDEVCALSARDEAAEAALDAAAALAVVVDATNDALHGLPGSTTCVSPPTCGVTDAGSAMVASAAAAAAGGSTSVAVAAAGHADHVARLKRWILPRGETWFYPVGKPSCPSSPSRTLPWKQPNKKPKHRLRSLGTSGALVV